MMQVITQAVKEWLEQHGSNLGDEALQVLQRSVIDEQQTDPPRRIQR
jgi:hypothetical protein